MNENFMPVCEPNPSCLILTVPIPVNNELDQVSWGLYIKYIKQV